MERSDEIRDLVLAFSQAVTAVDGSYVDRIMGAEPGALSIGTDPAEWWEGPRIAEVWREQFEAIGSAATFTSRGKAHGWVEGSVGWGADEIVMTVDGQETVIRITMVFHREGDGWRLVQSHASVGVANEQAFGQELPT